MFPASIPLSILSNNSGLSANAVFNLFESLARSLAAALTLNGSPISDFPASLMRLTNAV